MRSEVLAEDSKALFLETCVKIGVADLHKELCKNGWSTLGQFAFSSSYMPGQADDAPFFKGVVRKLALDDGDHRVSGLRRLFFEAYTVAASEMRRRHRRSD